MTVNLHFQVEILRLLSRFLVTDELSDLKHPGGILDLHPFSSSSTLDAGRCILCDLSVILASSVLWPGPRVTFDQINSERNGVNPPDSID